MQVRQLPYGSLLDCSVALDQRSVNTEGARRCQLSDHVHTERPGLVQAGFAACVWAARGFVRDCRVHAMFAGTLDNSTGLSAYDARGQDYD